MPSGYGQTAVLDTADWKLIVPLKTPLNFTGSRLTATMTGAFGGPAAAEIDSDDGSISWIADPITGLSTAVIVQVPKAARGGWRATNVGGQAAQITVAFDVHRFVAGSPADEWLGRSSVLVLPASDSDLVLAGYGTQPILINKQPAGGILLPALQTGPQGPEGPPGPAAGGAGSAQVFAQATPAATWVIPHGFGRRPLVAVYDASGAELLADLAADASAVTVTFAQPTAGSAVLA
jgi:hypothetical protein